MNEIKYHDQLVAELFDAQPQPAFWMKPIFTKDEIVDFEYSYCNEEMFRYTGLTKEQLIGVRLSATLTLKDDAKKKVLQELKDVYLTGKKFQDTIFNVRLNKHYSFLRSKVQDGVLTIMQDRSEEYKIINELEHQKNLLNTVFNASQAGMFTLQPLTDEKGVIIDFIFGIANEAVAAYIGETAQALKGALGSTYFPAYKTNGLFDIYKDTCQTGKTYDFDFHYDDGYDVYFHINTVKSGEEILVTFTDQTALKKAQKDLEATVEELKRSNVHLEEFAYAASHDLKEPIRKIHFFADRLKKQYASLLDEQGIQTFNRMEAATDRMRSLVDDLLSYSQVSLRPRAFEEVDLNKLMGFVTSDLELEIEEKKASVHFEKLPVVKGHMRQLQQLFQNLLGNALKYTRHGTPPEISITSFLTSGKDSGMNVPENEANKQFYRISISDNGIGFEQKDAERIFNVFQRLHGNAEYKGTGVGLSIVRKVAENHKAHIDAIGTPGRGSTFRLLLPA